MTTPRVDTSDLRDPCVTPIAGDVLFTGRRNVTVVRTSAHRVTYTYADLPSMEVYTMLRSAWRRYACLSGCLTNDDGTSKIGATGRPGSSS